MKYIPLVLVLVGMGGGVQAQPSYGPAANQGLVPAPGILRNAAAPLHAEGDTLWVGPLLNLTTDGGQTWWTAEADSLQSSPRNRVYSIDVEGEEVWVGLGYAADGVPAAAGFLHSEDGGRTFRYRFPQLDLPGDTVVTYGASMLRALEVVVPEQSPPLDLDYDPVTGVVWVAGWASGIRRFVDADGDGQRAWQRVVLPPDELTEIRPEEAYDFALDPRGGAEGSYNHLGFSVLVDEEGVVWAGTARGVNRSRDGGRSWRRFSFQNDPVSLTGSWVVALAEQPRPGRNPIWMATWNAGEIGEAGQDGITVTHDGGETFEQVLLGERVVDFAFRGETVYAAGRNRGLFISDDAGRTWRTVRDFRSAVQHGGVIRPDVDVLAVATTEEALWMGTDDGLLKSLDEGRSWILYRAEVPLHPELPTARVPSVETFAYPNPFSPGADRLVRIRYEGAGGPAEVRIFDFSMTLVRRLVGEGGGAGVHEVVWDGTDEGGLRVANGAYLYAVDAADQTVWGKILVLE